MEMISEIGLADTHVNNMTALFFQFSRHLRQFHYMERRDVIETGGKMGKIHEVKT